MLFEVKNPWGAGRIGAPSKAREDDVFMFSCFQHELKSFGNHMIHHENIETESQALKVLANWYPLADSITRIPLEYFPAEGVVRLESGFWGVIGSEADEDDAWGTYASKESAIRARENLLDSGWDANTVRTLTLSQDAIDQTCGVYEGGSGFSKQNWVDGDYLNPLPDKETP